MSTDFKDLRGGMASGASALRRKIGGGCRKSVNGQPALGTRNRSTRFSIASRRRRTACQTTKPRDGSLDYGPNRLPSPSRASALRVLLDQFRSIVVVLLIAAAGISLALGDLLEAAAIGAVLVINTLIGFAMELRARRAMEAILGLDVPIASVVRAGRLRDDSPRKVSCQATSSSSQPAIRCPRMFG